MKKVLVVQSRSGQERLDRERKEYERAVADLAQVDFVSTLDFSLAWESPEEILKDHDAVLIGGSGEFDLHGGRAEDDPARTTAREIVVRIKSFVDAILFRNIPVLGICFGHQLIAETRGGNIISDHSQKKTGTFEVHLTQEGKQDPLFSSLPERFLAQYGHKDSVTGLPAGATLMATGERCRFSALRYGSKAYTTQFHPEFTATDFSWKLEHSPGYLPEGVDSKDIVRESPEALRIVPLFIERVV